MSLTMDWTVAVTTAISAAAGLSGAALGYLGAIRQGQSETERQREQHREDERRHRQGVYHDLLDHYQRLLGAVHGADPMTPEQFAEWRARFIHLTNGARLFGATAVAEAVEPIVRGVAEFDGAMKFTARPPGETHPGRMEYCWAPMAEQMHDRALAMQSAMRSDVSTP